MKWILHFDGGCFPNPGGAVRYGWHLDTGDGDPIAQGAGAVPGLPAAERTNNSAEFHALLFGLRAALAAEFESPTCLEIVGDSQVAVRAASGRYKMSAPHLRRLADQIRAEIQEIRAAGVEVLFTWVPRKQNARADALAGV